jgi:hypothetical protein
LGDAVRIDGGADDGGHCLHGAPDPRWDVAKATGQDPTLPADLVTECVQLVTPMDAMLRMPGVCAPEVKVPDAASAHDKFIAFMGRNP